MAWSNDMEGHAQKCVERYGELANKKLCLDDHHFKKEELESVGELSEVCSHVVLKCLYLARIDRPDILWSVNKLARSVTKWAQACDRRLVRLISYIHHTSNYRQYCHVGNTAQHCRLGFYQDSDFTGDLEDSKSTSGGILGILGSRTFVGCARSKRQYPTLLQNLRASLWMLDCEWMNYLRLILWDVVIEVLRSSNNNQPQTKQATGNRSREKTSKPKQASGNRCDVRDCSVDQLSNVDHVTTNANSSQGESQLYIFEDNEAIIKIINKGTSPTMRHVSRTHRVALD